MQDNYAARKNRVMLQEIEVKSAATKILAEIAFYAKHGSTVINDPVYIAGLISDYCNDDTDREDKIADIVWPILRSKKYKLNKESKQNDISNTQANRPAPTP